MKATCLASGENAGAHTAPDKFVSGTVRMREEGAAIGPGLVAARVVIQRLKVHPPANRRAARASNKTRRIDSLRSSMGCGLDSGSLVGSLADPSGWPNGPSNTSTGLTNR